MHDDEAAVRRLLDAYCDRLDAGDLDGVAALFARGAFRSPAGTNLTGAEEVRRVYDPIILYDDGTPRTKHVLGSVVVTVDTVAGTATARSDFVVLQAAGPTPLQPVLVGRYHDTFTRTDAVWSFTERMVRPDLEGDLSRHMRNRG